MKDNIKGDFPWPVLQKGRNDYKENEFNTLYNLEKIDGGVVVTVSNHFKSEFLNRKLKSAQAKLVYHIEQKSVRKTIDSVNLEADKIEVYITEFSPGYDIDILPVIIANEVLPESYNTDWHDIYKGNYDFTIPKYGILAIGERKTLGVSLVESSITKIFQIEMNPSQKYPINFKIGGNKIIINVSSEMNEAYNLVKTKEKLPTTFLLYQAIQYAILNLDQDPDRLWNKVVREKLIDVGYVGDFSEKISVNDVNEWTSKMLSEYLVNSYLEVDKKYKEEN